MSLAARSDLLAWLPRFAAGAPVEVRRVERWRRRGRSGARVARSAELVAAALAARGVGPGDRVALVLQDGPLWHAAFFGVLRAGAVAVPLDVSLDPRILARRAAEIAPAALITEREAPPVELDAVRLELSWRDDPTPAAPAPIPPDDPERTAEIVLTSGTTGAPDAVAVRHRNLTAVLDAVEAAVARRRRILRGLPTPMLAVTVPLSHLYGQMMGVFVPAILGARVSMVEPMPAPELARALRDEGAWVLATVPRTLELLGRHLRALGEARWGRAGLEERLAASLAGPALRRPLRLRALRRALGWRLGAVVSGGASLEPETEDLWRALGYVVVQGYGLTETAPMVTLTDPFDPAPGTLGRPLPGVRLRIAADGEILVRGPNVVPARAGGPAVDPEGWLHTGDLGRLDEAGRLRFLGRKGERIVTTAGATVDTGPVAAALRRQAGILDAVVLERPWGAPGVVAAALTVAPGADPRAAVRAANQELPDAARVREWGVWPEAELPRTRTGKPRQAAVRAWLAERAPEGREPPREPAPPDDPLAALAREIVRIADVDAAALDPDDRLSDVLGSLDRVELIARLEEVYRVALGEPAFAGERTLAGLAEDLARAAAPAGRALPSAGARPSASPPRTADTGAREEPAGPGAAPKAPPVSPAPALAAQAPPTTPGPARADRVPRARWRGSAPARAGRFALRELVLHPLWRSLFSMDVAGVERFADLAPPFLVAANHSSELDPGAVLFGLPRPRRSRIATTAMWEWFEDARTGPFFYRLAVLGLDLVPLLQRGDWRPTLEIAGRVADRGSCPLVFPEGERTLDGGLLPFHAGVAILARDLHLPIVPCAIAGLLAVLPKGAHWPRGCWRSRARLAVRYGEPLPAPRPGDDPRAVVAALRERIEVLHAEAWRAAGRP